jgi:acetoin utilization protein AcuB
MIVGMWMARKLVTIEPQTSVMEAAALMARKHIRRLPVVEPRAEGPHLVGFISATDIYHAFPAEVNPFAAVVPASSRPPIAVCEIMSRRLRTTTPETPIEDAAKVMREEKIGSLLVLREGVLVGMITESDIFRAFVSLFDSSKKVVRITFDVSKGEDILTLIATLAAQHGVRVKSLFSCQQEDRPVCVVRATGTKIDSFLDALWKSGHPILNILRS